MMKYKTISFVNVLYYNLAIKLVEKRVNEFSFN